MAINAILGIIRHISLPNTEYKIREPIINNKLTPTINIPTKDYKFTYKTKNPLWVLSVIRKADFLIIKMAALFALRYLRVLIKSIEVSCGGPYMGKVYCADKKNESPRNNKNLFGKHNG